MSKIEIWIGGFPSFFGGADTELDHNIDLWCSKGVEVHLVPLPSYDPLMLEHCEARGCIAHQYEPGIFRSKIVASFCNGEFLRMLPEIMNTGRPRAIAWFNCMTWTFQDEITAHQNGWIDYFGFVSDYQQKMLQPQLEIHRPIKVLAGYRPYYSLTNPSQKLIFNYRVPKEHFAVGRISRDDAGKFSDDMWDIFHKVTAPIPKKVMILGFGSNAKSRCGVPPSKLDWQTWEPNAVPVGKLYNKLHAIIHKTGGSRESYCRIVPEAYASGVPLIVEKDFAFPELIDDGVTGYLCQSSDEMSFRASELAFDETKRKNVIDAGYDYLRSKIASADLCWKAWQDILL